MTIAEADAERIPKVKEWLRPVRVRVRPYGDVVRAARWERRSEKNAAFGQKSGVARSDVLSASIHCRH